MSSTARNCPHCGWRKSQVGTVIAWIVALVIPGFFVLVFYQIGEANKAHAKLKKELDKPIEVLKGLKP
jgi:hypothetical protein